VSKDNPVEAKILNLNWGGFTGESTCGGSRGVLGSDLNSRLDVFEDVGNLKTDRSNNDIDFSFVEGEFVEDLRKEIFSLGQGVIGFPVSTDEESSESHCLEILLIKLGKGWILFNNYLLN